MLLGGTVEGAEAAATRLTHAIGDLGIPGLGACAGVVALEAGVPARETTRRASVSLQTARSLGRGTVIRDNGMR